MDVVPVKPTKHAIIAIIAIVAIVLHLVMHWTGAPGAVYPLYVALVLGGVPLVWDLFLNLIRFEFGSDLLAGISIVTAAILGEYLAGTLVVLMLSGGGALEAYAVRSASSVLQALARRMPSVAHRQSDSTLEDIALDDVQVGDRLVVLPHEVCPVDGVVLEGHSAMDESYLTGEPYVMSKTPGAQVISGAINGEAALTIRAEKRPVDSRYAKIMEVMRASEQQRPRMRRLADRLGAFYTPIAVGLAIIAWIIGGEATRFLAVLVVATPCPLLIAVPVAIIGSISLAAKRSIIVRDPLVLERAPRCKTMILDKTGTLTYGKPQLVNEHVAPGLEANQVLAFAAALEQYSKHPLASAVVNAAKGRKIALREANHMSEPPGQGLRGDVQGRAVRITSRHRLRQEHPEIELPPQEGGLECVVMLDGVFAALYRFRDAPRQESQAFIGHLGPRHGIERVMLVSGDRASEVEYLAKQVGIDEVHADQSPEQKVAIVRQQSELAQTIFVGDGINDAPALMTANVGVALGTANDVTIEAAGAVIMDNSLERVDELLHISHRMRRIALQSAVGGMALSIVGMLIAAAGYLPPVGGALVQEAIDVVAVLNALRVAIKPGALTDF
ncbi:MAG: cadmium-translocating P-type ATPase [Phycisphaerales bacterium]|nr:cadmium-translocating P-type ATPase [Phycisphaerales bacterium]